MNNNTKMDKLSLMRITLISAALAAMLIEGLRKAETIAAHKANIPSILGQNAEYFTAFEITTENRRRVFQ